MLNLRRKSQYELQFKKWQFRKNRTAEEWKIVAHKLTERKKEHKDSEVVLNGNLINPKKLRKETLRYGSLSAAIEILPPGRQLYICVNFGFSPQKKVHRRQLLRASLFALHHQNLPHPYQRQQNSATSTHQ